MRKGKRAKERGERERRESGKREGRERERERERLTAMIRKGRVRCR